MRAHQIMTKRRSSQSPLTRPLSMLPTLCYRQRILAAYSCRTQQGKMVGIISEGDFIRRAEIGTQRRRDTMVEIPARSRARMRRILFVSKAARSVKS